MRIKNKSFFIDFMDALSDPRGFLGAQQKQSEQINQIGIELSEKSGASGDISADSKKAEKGKEEKKEEPLVFEPVTIELLRQEKGFQKIARKQQKELDTLKKRQSKEKTSVQKAQCAAIEKLIKGRK